MTTKNYLQKYISQKVKYFRTQNKMSPRGTFGTGRTRTQVYQSTRKPKCESDHSQSRKSDCCLKLDARGIFQF